MIRVLKRWCLLYFSLSRKIKQKQYKVQALTAKDLRIQILFLSCPPTHISYAGFATLESSIVWKTDKTTDWSGKFIRYSHVWPIPWEAHNRLISYGKTEISKTFWLTPLCNICYQLPTYTDIHRIQFSMNRKKQWIDARITWASLCASCHSVFQLNFLYPLTNRKVNSNWVITLN